LKLFFGADPAALAPGQLAAHRERLRAYEELMRAGGEAMPHGMRLALESGLGHEKEFVRFWKRAAADGG